MGSEQTRGVGACSGGGGDKTRERGGRRGRRGERGLREYRGIQKARIICRQKTEALPVLVTDSILDPSTTMFFSLSYGIA